MITVLVVRDPDSSDEIRVWNKNTEITYDRESIRIVYVDAGRGHDYEDWIETAADETLAVPYTLPRRAIAAAYADPPGHKYIDGWPLDD